MKPPKRLLAALAAMALFAVLASPQMRNREEREREPLRLPNGKSQQEEILKAEHESNLKDAAQLTKMSEEVKVELEKNDRHVLSMSTLKKLEEIEKLARKMRGRLRNH
jgi:hypothetical protein